MQFNTTGQRILAEAKRYEESQTSQPFFLRSVGNVILCCTQHVSEQQLSCFVEPIFDERAVSAKLTDKRIAFPFTTSS